MQDRVKHHLRINIEVRLRMLDKVKHRLPIVIEVRLHMQDKVKHLKQDGMELVHNSGLQHLYRVNTTKIKRGLHSPLFCTYKYHYEIYQIIN